MRVVLTAHTARLAGHANLHLPTRTNSLFLETRARHCAGDWKTIEGEFNAIMAVVMPCRSDRSDSGLAPFAHMADGIIHLILVRKCSAAQYLRFLSSIPGVIAHFHFQKVKNKYGSAAALRWARG